MSRDRRHDFPELPAVETLRDALYDARGVTLDVLRLDRLHPLWGGNKVFKLLPNLHRAEALGLRRVISFGWTLSLSVPTAQMIGLLVAVVGVGALVAAMVGKWAAKMKWEEQE